MPLASFLPCSLIRQLSKTLASPLPHHRCHAPLRRPIPTCCSLRHNNKHLPRTITTTSQSPKSRKKQRQESPSSVLSHRLGHCSRDADLAEALRLFDAAVAASTPLSLHHYNPLLYLCSLHPPSRAFEIFDHMLLTKVPPNEATFTSLARVASAPQPAFSLVKKMQSLGIPPKLRSYGPALFGFCEKGDFLNAREVERHMDENGIVPEEAELAALFKVYAGCGRADEVYRVLQRMRGSVRKVSEETAVAVEEWFGSGLAERVGLEGAEEVVREAVRKGGGGWHGVGWLGKGKWSVGRSEMESDGTCRKCGERLVCIDIDPVETEEFARSLAGLASEKEVRADFTGFQVRFMVTHL